MSNEDSAGVNSKPGFEFPVLTPEARARTQGDDTPGAREARRAANEEKAIEIATRWDADKSHRLSDLLTVGGKFLPLRHNMRVANQAVLEDGSDPVTILEVALKTIKSSPDFAEALVKLGEREISATAGGSGHRESIEGRRAVEGQNFRG